jgi:hypothetical protein
MRVAAEDKLGSNILPHFYGDLYLSWGTLLVAQLVEALRYKPEGREFDSRWRHCIFFLL